MSLSPPIYAFHRTHSMHISKRIITLFLVVSLSLTLLHATPLPQPDTATPDTPATDQPTSFWSKFKAFGHGVGVKLGHGWHRFTGLFHKHDSQSNVDIKRRDVTIVVHPQDHHGAYQRHRVHRFDENDVQDVEEDTEDEGVRRAQRVVEDSRVDTRHVWAKTVLGSLEAVDRIRAGVDGFVCGLSAGERGCERQDAQIQNARADQRVRHAM